MKKYGQWGKLIDYFLKKNSQINLSAIRDAEGVYIKHIVDSLEVLKLLVGKEHETLSELLQKETTQLLDLGTGGGFPLLPLAMKYPMIHCFGLDARRKKVDAVNDIIKQLGLNNAKVLRGRAEEHAQQYDILTARSVAYIDKLFHRSLPLVKKGGYMIFWKLFTSEEDNDFFHCIKQKKYTLVDMHHYTLPHDEVERIIYVIQKEK